MGDTQIEIYGELLKLQDRMDFITFLLVICAATLIGIIVALVILIKQEEESCN